MHKIVEKPWGFEKIWAKNEKYVGKILHINAGHQLSKQYHKIKDETIYILKGTLFLEIDGLQNSTQSRLKTIVLGADQSYRITPGTIHRFRAPEDEQVILIEVSTPELDDVIRLEDDYGRS